MKCFSHSNESAVGLCKACNKAVCHDCIKESQFVIACSDECLKQAKEIVEIEERSKKIYGIGAYESNKLATGVWVWLIFAFSLWMINIYNYYQNESLDFGSTFMALAFTIIAFLAYKSSKKIGINC